MKPLLLLFALTISVASAQSPLDWLSNLVNTEERLIHREEVGPYLVSADGQRLVNNPYLKLDIRDQGAPIPPESEVEVFATLHHQGESRTTNYTPEPGDGLFVIDPLELPGATDWTHGGWLELDLSIGGPAGEAWGTVDFYIYPPKPETGTLFRVVNFGLPFVLLGLFAAIYKVRRVKLQRYQGQA